MKKYINTLIEDIKESVLSGRRPSDEHLDIFANDCRDAIANALSEAATDRKPTIRMSNIGTPDRKLWYSLKGYAGEKHSATQLMSFMFGHLIEAYMLLLARHAGHTVEDQQKEIVLNGVVGHMDARIDGIITDVKGMSPFGFNKFQTGKILNEDAFGYIMQISGYAQAEQEDDAAFLVFNKATGAMTLFHLDDTVLKNASKRIDHIRSFLAKDTPPNRCFADIEDGKSGNRMLDKGCSWCPFKAECWKDCNDGKGLRAFKYSNGVKFLTVVIKEPRVEEINLNEDCSEEAEE